MTSTTSEIIDLELPNNGTSRKSGINESDIEYVDLNANPIQGCYHACRYC